MLYVIYAHDGNGAVSYALPDGAIVSYWFGHRFALRGRRYFTGFSSKSNGADGPDNDTYWMSDGRVAIGQATFELVDAGDGLAWWRPDTDGYVGEFGGDNRPASFDHARQVRSYETADGRMLLAVPTRDAGGDPETASFALFLFDPDGVDALAFRRWGYLGSLPAGDGSAGALSFRGGDGDGLPDIHIAPTEADIGATDARASRTGAIHVFDAGLQRYRP